MAGPGAGVLLPHAWSASDVTEFRTWLAKAFRPDRTSDWWVLRDPRRLGLSGRLRTGPMLVEPGPCANDDADETACLAEAVGFAPSFEIVLAAAVNGHDDHRLLAEVAAATPRRYSGVVNLDGRLPIPAEPGSGASHPAQAHSGRWSEIPYRSSGRDVATYHVVDADFLIWWRRHPLVRMVK